MGSTHTGWLIVRHVDDEVGLWLILLLESSYEFADKVDYGQFDEE